MHKLDYPTDIVDLESFKNEYVDALQKIDLKAINKHLNKILYNKVPLTFSELVTLSFEELVKVDSSIKTYIQGQKKVRKKKIGKTTAFEELFNYSENQSSIASFFMKRKDLKIKTCYYCGIDYINSFTDLKDYSGPIDFLNNADIDDLKIIPGVGDKIANGILSKRKKLGQFKNLNQAHLPNKVELRISSFSFEDGHNHFTLDHVLPQSDYKYFSLCLFNLVPSCYPCNSKFKNGNNFLITNIHKISPTSSQYNLPTNLKFGLLVNDGKKIEDIKSVKDFVICNKVTVNKAEVEKYLKIFKINGRYVYHKDKIFKIIQLKINYSNSRIKEISGQTGIPQKELRKLIFGEELFSDDFNKDPLVKLKRDIAYDLNIKDVITN